MNLEVMTGLAIHLLQEVIVKEVVAQVNHLLHRLPAEVVVGHQVVVITHQVVVIPQEAVAILQEAAIVHQEVEGKF